MANLAIYQVINKLKSWTNELVFNETKGAFVLDSTRYTFRIAVYNSGPNDYVHISLDAHTRHVPQHIPFASELIFLNGDLYYAYWSKYIDARMVMIAKTVYHPDNGTSGYHVNASINTVTKIIDQNGTKQNLSPEACALISSLDLFKIDLNQLKLLLLPFGVK